MAVQMKCSIEKLWEYFLPDFVTGKLFWKKLSGKRAKIGDEAGGLTKAGYRFITLENQHYYGHNILWAMYYNVWPVGILDHINGIRDDNRPENLREVTVQQNVHNRTMHKNNKSGIRGVYWDKQTTRWRVKITFNGVVKHLGRYKDKELAELVYEVAADKYFGKYRRKYSSA